MPYQIAGLGYKPDLTDFRDQPYVRPATPNPPTGDVTATMPPIWNQLALGSCVGHGVNRCVEFVFRMTGAIDFTPSRLLTYYNARYFEGTVPYDAGAEIRDGIKAVATFGVVDEGEWPYLIQNYAATPPPNVVEDATHHLAISYFRLDPDLDQIRSCITEGFPVVCGMTVYQSFMSDEVAASGIVPMPASGEVPVGGHCVAVGGYDDLGQYLEFDNSWGERWGLSGRGRLPYAAIEQGLVSDLWTIRAES